MFELKSAGACEEFVRWTGARSVGSSPRPAAIYDYDRDDTDCGAWVNRPIDDPTCCSEPTRDESPDPIRAESTLGCRDSAHHAVIDRAARRNAKSGWNVMLISPLSPDSDTSVSCPPRSWFASRGLGRKTGLPRRDLV